jgi:TrmH family RNA methyltransferase
MGSAFRLPIWTGPDYGEVIAWCRERAIETICADADATQSYTDLDWTRSSALIMGPESTGLTDDETKRASRIVSIPMHGSAESLNVSVAAGILLFEAARQRSVLLATKGTKGTKDTKGTRKS